jgi:hypothetical protein
MNRFNRTYWIGCHLFRSHDALLSLWESVLYCVKGILGRLDVISFAERQCSRHILISLRPWQCLLLYKSHLVLRKRHDSASNFILVLSRYSDGIRTGRPGFDSRQGMRYFLFSTASIPVLRPTQPPIQWIAGAPSPKVKRLGHEADHSPPSTSEDKYGGDIPHTTSWRGA